MLFSPEEKMQLFNRLPALELSYEPKLHKKVYYPLYYIIPKGPKALVWYTYWKEEHVCLLILLNEKGNYSDIKVFPSCFSDALALGTIIYGTHFYMQQHAYFTCEQLYYYKGMPVKNKNKFCEQLLDMFTKEVEQIAYTNTSLVVGLPVITESYEEALEIMADLPYRTYGIGGAPLGDTPTPPFRGTALGGTPLKANIQGGTPPFGSTHNKNKTPLGGTAHGGVTPKGGCGGIPQGCGGVTPKGLKGVSPLGSGGTAPILVKAGLAADTYMLYNPNDNSFIGTAMIPTYKSSVFLNGLFRHIKENTNLDFLEESDDEDEFENTQLDKFVDLDKKILMECVFLKRFQKWQPVKVIKMYK